MEAIKQSRTLLTLIIIALAAIGLVAIASSKPTTSKSDVLAAAQAQQNNDESKKEDKQEKAKDGNSKSARYTYVAQPGDSYSVLARKAVQTYGIVNDVRMSQAEIIAAETSLTIKAGSPLLLEGKAVQFNAANIQSAVEEAQAMSDTEESQWQAYVPFVDFNTDSNGEQAQR